MSFLENIRINFISLVNKGANQKSIIWKSRDGDTPYKKDVDIAKFDEDERLVYGIVYSPDELDSQEDEANAKEIQKAAHQFMKDAKTADGVDKDHSFETEPGVFVAESFIIGKGNKAFPDAPEKSWAVVIKVENDDIWADVKSGKIGGLSMGGVADKINKSEGDGSILSQIKKLLTGSGDEVDEKQVQAIVKTAVKEAVEDAGNDTLKKEDVIKIVTAAMKEVVKVQNDKIEKLEEQTSGSSQDESDLKKSDTDLEKLGAEIAKTFVEGK